MKLRHLQRSRPACLPVCLSACLPVCLSATIRITKANKSQVFFVFIGLIWSSMAWAQWSSVGCDVYSSWSSVVMSQGTIYIPRNMQPGSVLGAFMGGIYGRICTASKVNMLGIGENDMVSSHLTLPVGSKAVNNMTVIVNGQSFQVFTTPALEPVGLGYVMRFRTRKYYE